MNITQNLWDWLASISLNDLKATVNVSFYIKKKINLNLNLEFRPLWYHPPQRCLTNETSDVWSLANNYQGGWGGGALRDETKGDWELGEFITESLKDFHWYPVHPSLMKVLVNISKRNQTSLVLFACVVARCPKKQILHLNKTFTI